MFHTVPTGDTELTRPEQRLVAMLRLWRHSDEWQEKVLQTLEDAIGRPRAVPCLQAFLQLTSLLQKHAWHPLTMLTPGATGYSADELSISRFVTNATEQDRDKALAEASFLVTPVAMLPLLCSAGRVGLPLLCEECRARLRCSMRGASRNLD